MPDFIARQWKAIFAGIFAAIAGLLGYKVDQAGVPIWVSTLTGLLFAVVSYSLTWIKANKKDSDPRIEMLEKALEAVMANRGQSNSAETMTLPSGNGPMQQPDFTGNWLPPARKTSAATTDHLAAADFIQPAWLSLQPLGAGDPAAADYRPPVPASGLCSVSAT